jgi:hypothetical protein
LKMEAIRSSETSVITSTRCHIPEDCFLHANIVRIREQMWHRTFYLMNILSKERFRSELFPGLCRREVSCPSILEPAKACPVGTQLWFTGTVC